VGGIVSRATSNERLEPVMARILGIDFGERRVGLAISDPEGRLALPLTTLVRKSDHHVIQQIVDIALQEGVEYLVVGEPLNLDGSRGPASARASSFARKLAEESDLPVEMTDETLTSVEAEERLRQAGIDPRRHPEKVDSTAAQILLQQYLNKPSARSDD
jgi:putative Holliday junction resolvase